MRQLAPEMRSPDWARRFTSGTSGLRSRPVTYGEVVAIDVETGIWAIDSEVLEAVDRLKAQRPEAINVFCERVGYRTLDSFGGGSLRRTD